MHNCHFPKAEGRPFLPWLRSRCKEKELDAGARAIPIYRDCFPADDGLAMA